MIHLRRVYIQWGRQISVYVFKSVNSNMDSMWRHSSITAARGVSMHGFRFFFFLCRRLDRRPQHTSDRRSRVRWTTAHLNSIRWNDIKFTHSISHSSGVFRTLLSSSIGLIPSVVDWQWLSPSAVSCLACLVVLLAYWDKSTISCLTLSSVFLSVLWIYSVVDMTLTEPWRIR